MENPQHKFLFPLLILVVLVIAGGTYFFTKVQKNEDRPIAVSRDRQNEQESVVDSDESTWYTYTNSEYGFSFKYPKDHFVNDNINLFHYPGYPIAQLQILISMCPNANCMSFQGSDWRFENDDTVIITVAAKDDNGSKLTAREHELLAENQKYVFAFNQPSQKETELFKKIHSTFAAIPIEDYVPQHIVKYTNQYFGFEFDYPAYFGSFKSAGVATDFVAEGNPLPSKKAALYVNVKYAPSTQSSYPTFSLFTNYGTNTYFDPVRSQFYTLSSFDDATKLSSRKYIEKKYMNGNLFTHAVFGEGTDEGWGFNHSYIVYNKKLNYFLVVSLPLSSRGYTGGYVPNGQVDAVPPVLESIFSSLKFTKDSL